MYETEASPNHKKITLKIFAQYLVKTYLLTNPRWFFFTCIKNEILCCYSRENLDIILIVMSFFFFIIYVFILNYSVIQSTHSLENTLIFRKLMKKWLINKMSTFSPQRWSDMYMVWSPLGTYLATFHMQGVQLWGGKNFERIEKFNQPGVHFIDFSPNEE